MQHQTETQKAPAAPRRAWVTPELRSLDLKQTLDGDIAFLAEGPWVQGDKTVYGDLDPDPS